MGCKAELQNSELGLYTLKLRIKSQLSNAGCNMFCFAFQCGAPRNSESEWGQEMDAGLNL